MKYSIIVPVYDVEEYLEKCLDSIIHQSFKNLEIILIDDGSTDNSSAICDKYQKKDKRIKVIHQNNKGVSYARNIGIKNATGDYFIFVDSDDYIEQDLITVLDKYVKNNNDVDLVKFEIKSLENDKSYVDKNEIFDNFNGIDAFYKLSKSALFVTPVSYLYNTKFLKKNKFKFAEGKVHEDFGLLPYVVLKANKVSSIDYVGYNYVIRMDSIMTSTNIQKVIKKNNDTLYHFDYLYKTVNNDESISKEVKKYFNSYIANALISKAGSLDGKVLNDYIKELKIRKVYNYFLTDNIKRKVKKILYRISPKLYIILFVK